MANDQSSETPQSNGPPLNAYIRHPAAPAMNFDHEVVNQRDLSNPELASHLQGFGGYISQGDGSSQTIHQLLGHVRSVRHQISFYSSDMAGITAWAEQAVAVIFWPDGSVRDPHGRVLFSPDPSAIDPEATMPWFPDALERKARSIDRLRTLDIAYLDSLPYLSSEFETPLPSVTDVVDRVTSLLAVAVRAESTNEGSPMPLEQIRGVLPRAFNGLTPTERQWLDETNPDPQTVINFLWRYECVPVLLWALQLLPTLDLPTTICDVPAITTTVLHTDWEDIEAGLSLRPVAEILDQADLYYRIHWAIVNSRVGSTPPVEGLDNGAVIERRYALEWLIGQPTPWDDVPMDT